MDEPLAYARASGDRMGLGMSLWVLSLIRVGQGRLEDARATATELEDVVMDLGPMNWAWVMHGIAEVALADGDAHTALAVSDEAMQHMREANPEVHALHLATKAEAFEAMGQHDDARREVGAALDATMSGGAPSDRVRALVTLARLDRRAGRPDESELHAHEALRLGRSMQHKRGVVDALEVLACCAADGGSHAEAARLLGAASVVRQGSGYLYRAPARRVDFAEARAAVDAALGAADAAAAWAEGEALSLDEACDYAARGRGERKRPATGWAALTATEARVATLAADGLTNVQVGEQLFISRHTVDSHLRHIYSKLGISTRAELATRVARQDGADA
jgi:ATP/maltotriose-dependent transcriptional regulator MalT